MRQIDAQAGQPTRYSAGLLGITTSGVGGRATGSIAALYDYEEFESSGRQPGTLKVLALANEKQAKKKPAKRKGTHSVWQIHRNACGLGLRSSRGRG